MAHLDSVTFTCQVCRCKLSLTGNFDALVDNRLGVAGTQALNASVFDNTNVDESFIVLDGKRQGPGGGHVGAPGRGLDESFVVLGSASLIRPSPQQLQLQQQQQYQQQQQQQNQVEGAIFGLDAKLQALAQIFEVASTHTQVDHPLCMDCVQQLKDEMEAQIQEAEREIAAYSNAVASLERENAVPLREEEFLEELSRLEEEKEKERRRAEALELELAEVQRELAALQGAAGDVDALEERYWHDYNDYQLALRLHVDERDALINRIDRAQQRLALLRNTNVYNDAFKIWHDGPFGTISGFRLGRTPDVPVEWDEINAAWGQAVLLLHTMAQACQLTFTTCRLLPMGSHPRVTDKRATYDLFGPVSKLWSANYDRAMVAYLGALKEFGEHARRTDMEEGRPERSAFEFPFAIDGDKVNGHTIKLTLNKDVRWTKALKFMLANLKLALQWMVRHDRGEMAAPALSALAPEPLTAS